MLALVRLVRCGGEVGISWSKRWCWVVVMLERLEIAGEALMVNQL